MIKRIVVLIFLVAMCALPLQGLANNKKVRLGYVEWDCATTTTYLAKAALEQKGYTVEVLPVSAAAMWMGVALGDLDAMLTAWLPITHEDYYKRNKDKVENLGVLVTGVRLGLAVPAYVTINSIEELNANADKFKKNIIGIDPGAGIMRLTENSMKDYKLNNLTLIDGSGAIMVASLGDAIRNKEWVVVTAWSPHWMFGRWDLRYLEDPKKSFGAEAEAIYKIGRLGLEKDMAEVHAFLKNFAYTSLEQLEGLMEANSKNGVDPLATAQEYLKKHPELLEEWFKKEK